MARAFVGDLHRDDWGRLVLVDGDLRRHEGIDPIRAFPLSAPTLGISLCDETGREAAWIDDLDNLPVGTRQLLLEEFALREFVPRILSIRRISSDSAPSDWEVETDRGSTTFVLDSEDNIRKIGKSRVMILDATGSRFEIPDVESLDAASRRRLERYI